MPPRTRACAPCRKQRIKCDATLPQCLMCIRQGRECPGPVTGALIISVDPLASRYANKRKSQPRSNVDGEKNNRSSSNVLAPTSANLVAESLKPQISIHGNVAYEAFYA